MAISVTDLITNLDTYIGDSSTDRVSTAQRYQYLSEACIWLNEELQNEHHIVSYVVNYLDKIYRYKVTTATADLLIGADLRRSTDLQDIAFPRKPAREIWEDIGQNNKESSWSIDRYDDDAFLVINHESSNKRILISNFDSLTDGGGTWAADATGSDANNVTQDINEFTSGSASLNFDVTVAQSVANKATIYNPSLNAKDLSSVEDLGSFTFDAYIPDVTNFSSFTLRWSDQTSVLPSTITRYWSATVTTDVDGSAFQSGWNTIKIDWQNATKTGSPLSNSIVYFQFDFNYTSSQVNDTDFRLDNFAICKPEKLTFYYISYYIGRNNSGTDIILFSAGTDVPFFSGKYDNYRYAVSHKAASLILYTPLRLTQEGQIEEAEAAKALNRYKKTFESPALRESRNFKIQGNVLRRRRRGVRIV